MTKEELKKEAEEFATKRYKWTENNFILEVSRKSYFAGAEPREMRIAELERKLEQTEKDLTDYQFNYPKIKDLEKENAELKRDKEDLIFIRNQNAKCMCEDKEQLTKAKEYINLLLMNCVGVYESTGKTIAEIQAEAEQFIKE